MTHSMCVHFIYSWHYHAFVCGRNSPNCVRLHSDSIFSLTALRTLKDSILSHVGAPLEAVLQVECRIAFEYMVYTLRVSSTTCSPGVVTPRWKIHLSSQGQSTCQDHRNDDRSHNRCRSRNFLSSKHFFYVGASWPGDRHLALAEGWPRSNTRPTKRCWLDWEASSSSFRYFCT